MLDDGHAAQSFSVIAEETHVSLQTPARHTKKNCLMSSAVQFDCLVAGEILISFWIPSKSAKKTSLMSSPPLDYL